jgi:Mn2+/Fe2+ NRAMP family transporter
LLNLLKLDRSILTLFKKIGPGLLYAAAVGVFHLVQSTRAGANYGWIMVAIVFLANLVKYPFFLIGPLYTYHKGKTILEGFQKLGKWSLWLYLLTTLASLYTTVAVISLICSSLISSIFHINYPLWFISLTLILIVIYLVYFGKFKQLSAIIKLIILLLSVSSIVALFLAFNSAENFSVFESSFSIFNRVDVLFLISLIGWMPAPLDIIIWQSEWMMEQQKIRAFTLKGTLFDFNVGY